MHPFWTRRNFFPGSVQLNNRKVFLTPGPMTQYFERFLFVRKKKKNNVYMHSLKMEFLYPFLMTKIKN